MLLLWRTNCLLNGIAYVARNFFPAQQAQRNRPGDGLTGRQMFVELIDFVRGFLHEFELHVGHLEKFILSVPIKFEVLLLPGKLAVQFTLICQIGQVFHFVDHDRTFHFRHPFIIGTPRQRKKPSGVKAEHKNDGPDS